MLQCPSFTLIKLISLRFFLDCEKEDSMRATLLSFKRVHFYGKILHPLSITSHTSDTWEEVPPTLFEGAEIF